MDGTTGAHVQSSTGSRWPDLASIRAYYDETQLDYRVLWLNPDNRAMHFGYWDETTRSHADSLLNMNRVLAHEIGIKPGDRVLDAGCGVGGSAIWLTKALGAEVVGITPVARQVKHARRYARQHGVAHRLTFEQQDYTRTTFPDASFDVIWAMESVCHAPDKRLFLAEARRLLKPGGRLGMVEYVRTRPSHPPAGEQLLHTWLSGWSIPDLATGEQFLEWMREAGFEDVRLSDITANVRRSSHRMYRIAFLSWPLALALHALRIRSNRQHANSRGAWKQYLALERNLWFYGMLAATVSK